MEYEYGVWVLQVSGIFSCKLMCVHVILSTGRLSLVIQVFYLCCTTISVYYITIYILKVMLTFKIYPQCTCG